MPSKKKEKKLPKIDAPKSYAWEFDSGLCYWSVASAALLRGEGKPSPEAKIRAVRLVKESDYRRLIKAWNARAK